MLWRKNDLSSIPNRILMLFLWTTLPGQISCVLLTSSLFESGIRNREVREGFGDGTFASQGKGCFGNKGAPTVSENFRAFSAFPFWEMWRDTSPGMCLKSRDCRWICLERSEIQANDSILFCSVEISFLYVKAEFGNCRCKSRTSCLQTTPIPCVN